MAVGAEMKEKQIKYFEGMLLIFNLLVVVLFSTFIYITTIRICNTFKARDFIRLVDAIPKDPRIMLILNCLLLLSLIVSYYLRENVFRDNIGIQYGSLGFDLIVCLIIVYALGFNYNGILLWVFANVISKVNDSHLRFIILFIALASFIGTNHGLILLNSNVYSIENYISYYDIITQKYLLGSYTTIQSLNIILFIIYMVYTLLVQRGTLDEVQILNQKLKFTNEELQNANVKLTKYADIKEKMGETKERNRLAREIHDTLGHTLTGISAGLDACITTVEQNPKLTKEQLEMLSSITREGINDVRRSVNELRPDALERQSLSQGIEKMLEDVREVSGINIYFENKAKIFKFDDDEEVAIYRVIQESVTNSVRHGKAKKIYITIEQNYSEIKISIKDDGIGASKDFKQGFGTKHIIERIELLKGTVTFDGAEGFKTEVTIPIRWGEEYD